MKQFIIIKIFIVLICFGSNAQVGINISQPSGVFHIDPKSNTPTVTTDDVIVNANGYMGLGTVSPTAKLHLSVPSGSTALRIVDGTEKVDRVLLSDAAGNASWGAMPGSGGEVVYLTTATTYPQGVITKLKLSSNTQYKVTSAGNYLIFIRWWAKPSALNNKTTNGFLFAYKNGVEVDSQEFYEPIYTANTYFSFSTVLLVSGCKRGDYLEIGVRPQTASWTTATSAHTRCTIKFFMM
ncbi:MULTISPECIES: hypothetical protein [unclassified Dysgonomonas]|uniref:hypothetical protein n=1 Tax=unclassified Dysgonomonas TaxID=2630389 RepID=UPI000682C9B7|nr:MULTISPECIES: hypothetical protein [unclassified Dysgonomonas]MBD8347120.1 hypothetical protein [Dysgonomonas sp. HGC4]MBF0574873.1 hypothetical protein [Dysgonomonas sp. GY617]